VVIGRPLDDMGNFEAIMSPCYSRPSLFLKAVCRARGDCHAFSIWSGDKNLISINKYLDEHPHIVIGDHEILNTMRM
jgi:hypothetical protein